MRSTAKSLYRRLSSDEGATATEYAFMLAMIALLAFTAISGLANTMNTMIFTALNTLPKGGGG